MPLIACVAIASFAFAGCATTPSAPDAVVAEGSPVSTAQAETATSVSPTPTTDPYCEHADAGYAALVTLLDHTDAKSAQTGRDGDGDVGIMNREGAAMLAAAEQVQLHWGRARSVVAGEGDAVQGAFDDYFTMLEAFAVPEATLAAQSATIDAYSVATAALLTQPGVLDAATVGASGLEQVLRYNVERCGV